MIADQVVEWEAREEAVIEMQMKEEGSFNQDRAQVYGLCPGALPWSSTARALVHMELVVAVGVTEWTMQRCTQEQSRGLTD